MITYLKGDATAPVGDGSKVVCHICNDLGLWGRGFVLAISKKWREPEIMYKNWYKGTLIYDKFALGKVQMVRVTDRIWIANMIAQHKVWKENGVPPIRYDALRRCLMTVALEAKARIASIHMPRIGCGLAGGIWEEVEIIINETLSDINVSVYDLKEKI